jgi:hypothetical protein
VRERGRKEEKQPPLSLSPLIPAPMAGGMASSSCRGAQSTRGGGGSGGSEGKLIQGKEGGRGMQRLWLRQEEGRREREAALALAVAGVMGGEKECRRCCVRQPGKSTYVRCRGIMGPLLGWASSFLSTFFSLFFPSPCCYAAMFFNSMASPHLITLRHHLSDWKGLKRCASPHHFKNIACVKVLHSHEDSIHSFQLVDSNNR